MIKLAVIGGVAAGMSAAAKARRVDPDLQITVLVEGEYISYGGCGLPYFIGGRIKSKEALIARTVEQMAGQSIEVRTCHSVRKINISARSLLVENLNDGGFYDEPYDRLVIACGARASIPPAENSGLYGVFTLRTIPDSLAIIDYLQKYRPRKAVIVGAGYIGLEMAENLLSHDCEVTVIQSMQQILPGMDPDLAIKVQQYLENQGIGVMTGTKVTGFEGRQRIEAVLAGAIRCPADIAILAAGVEPNSEIAAAAGIELGIKKAIKVDERCATSVDGIWAAGDCATIPHLLTGQDSYIALGTNANKQGRVAGENAAGGSASIRGVLGTTIAQIMDMEVSRTGLSENECRQAGIEFISHTIKSRTAAAYCPVSGAIWLKIIADRKSSRIIGAQIAGFAGSGKRIDALATAITVGSTVDELMNMDLAYSPPFSPVWDPILIALDQFK